MFAVRTITKDGRTMRSGRMRLSASIAERTTSAAQKYAPTTASPVSPKCQKHAATRSAVAISTAG